MEVENIILSEVSQAQKAKNCMFPSYADFRSRENVVLLLNMGHTLRGEHVGWLGKGRKAKTWKCLMCLQERSECNNLKMTEITMGRWLGRSEEVW
jgi:hypothetical protein